MAPIESSRRPSAEMELSPAKASSRPSKTSRLITPLDFPFLSLPKELRLIIYDYLSKRTFRPLLRNKPELLQDGTFSISPSFMRVNKFINQEITSYLQLLRNQVPITVRCQYVHDNETGPEYRTRPLHHAPELVRMLELGQAYDNRTTKPNTTKTRAFDVFTIKVPALSTKNYVRSLQRAYGAELWEFDDAALQAYGLESLAKLHRDPGACVNIKYVVDKEAD